MPKPEITLRPLEEQDCTKRYADWLNDPEVNRYLETRYKEQTIESIEDYWWHQQEDDRALMAICLDGRHIGNLKIGPVHATHNHADLSYFIGERSEWGKGYATEAVRQACDHAFKVMKVHRLQAGLYAGNSASKSVLRKNGFAFEGSWRNALKTDNGWSDHLWYGRCADQVSL
jgi:RimJ/RimL family protein N-acetyltransferase